MNGITYAIIKVTSMHLERLGLRECRHMLDIIHDWS